MASKDSCSLIQIKGPLDATLTLSLGGLQWKAETGIKSAWAASPQLASAAAWHLITEQGLSAGRRWSSIFLM